MKKVTKKMVSEFLAETKAELNWCVISFNKETHLRDLAYGGFDFMHAFAVMTEQLAKDFDVILTNKEGWDYISEYETANHKRITYAALKPYQVKVSSYSFEIKNARQF